jgi:nitric oxide reductase NorQ protein
MSTKEQSRQITLVFQVGKDRFQVFNVNNWRVRSENLVQIENAGSPSTQKIKCDCNLYRFEDKCQHTKAIAAAITEIKTFARNNEWSPHEKAIDWRKTDKRFVLILDESKKEVIAAVHPEVGNLSAFNLVWLLTSDEVPNDIQKEIDDPKSVINPLRIYAECKASADKGLSLIDGAVMAAGKLVPTLRFEDAPIERDFDEKLTEAGSPVETQVQAPPVNDWKSVKRPAPGVFYVSPDDWEQMIYTMYHGGNVLLTGPSGSGKSELAYIAAKATGVPISAFNFGAMQEPRTTLIGNTHFDKSKGTWFAESRFVRAVKDSRHVVLLDELSRDKGAAAHNILLPLLDRQGYLALDESETSPIIKKGAGVSFIATANVGAEYTGTEALDKALRDRFDTVIDITFPPKDYEIKILMSRAKGLRAGDASRMVEIAVKQRHMADVDGEFVERISTRMLLAAAKRVGDGMSVEAAMKYCVVNQFSNEGGDASDRTKILQVIQKGGK